MAMSPCLKENGQERQDLADLMRFVIPLQSGASSHAKHGGAYFSALKGSIKDPITVPGRHEVTGV